MMEKAISVMPKKVGIIRRRRCTRYEDHRPALLWRELRRILLLRLRHPPLQRSQPADRKHFHPMEAAAHGRHRLLDE